MLPADDTSSDHKSTILLSSKPTLTIKNNLEEPLILFYDTIIKAYTELGPLGKGLRFITI